MGRIYIILLFALFGFVSCEYNPKYEEVATSPNYYDSLYHISFLKETKQFILEDTIDNQNRNSISNSFFLNGFQNINLFEELEISYKLNKPFLIYFTAHGGTNCRRMDELILSNQDIISYIEKEFHFIPLNVDDRTNLPKENWIDNRLIDETRRFNPFRKIGIINSWTQVAVSRSGSQPTFIGLDINRNLGDATYTSDKEEFLSFLKGVVEKYKMN